MKKFLVFAFLLTAFSSFAPTRPASRRFAATAPASTESCAQVYDRLDLAKSGLSRSVFDLALRGWQQIKHARPIVAIADFSQASSNKRLYVIDLEKGKLLFNTYVSHGRNSGDLMAHSFSNINSSFMSSLGFYKTLGTYQGKHGLSLKLEGLEKGFNDQAFNRAIVMHGADYVCEDFIKRTGRLGRSQGCPAVSNAESKSIIQAIKGGSCLFLYSPDRNYLTKSNFLKV